MLDTIEELDIFALRSDESTLDADKVELLKISIQEKGLICPIAVSEQNEVIAGHHRLAAYKKLYQEQGDAYRHIQVRTVQADNATEVQYLKTTEKLFHPRLSVIEKVEHFQSYFEELKYGEKKHKTTTIFKTLDISRRTFFNLRAIAERMSPAVRDRIKDAGLQGLAHSTPQLLALCKLDEAEQQRVLDVVEKQKHINVFEAIRQLRQQDDAPKAVKESALSQTRQSIARRFLKSPVIKLEKDLRESLRQLSHESGVGQNELFNEIFAAGLEIIEQKYR